MIKANELRVGNFYDWRQDDTYYGIDTITCITNDSVLNQNSMIIPFEQMQPIPLTEEWLLKFGLEQHVELIFSREKKSEFAVKKWINTSLRKVEWIVFFGMTMIRNIKYVHELQNLYFALTGEELEIKDAEL